MAQTVRLVAPDVIVNAAAYTAVDRAEPEACLAHAINAVTTVVLARESARLGAWLTHYSTDYVFNGSVSTPWTEDSPTGPLNAYGQSKSDRDLEPMRHLGVCYRTAWLIKHKMLEVMRRREERRQLTGRIEMDEHWAVNTILGNLKTAMTGTYHAIKFAMYAHRTLVEVQYRFNRRYDLRAILPRLVHAVAVIPAINEAGGSALLRLLANQVNTCLLPIRPALNCRFYGQAPRRPLQGQRKSKWEKVPQEHPLGGCHALLNW